MLNIRKTVFAALITIFSFYSYFTLDLNFQFKYIRPKPQSFRFGKYIGPHAITPYIGHPNYPTLIRNFNWTKTLLETKLNEAKDVVKMDIGIENCPNCFLNASCYMKFNLINSTHLYVISHQKITVGYLAWPWSHPYYL